MPDLSGLLPGSTSLEPNQRWLERLQNWPQEEADTVPVPIVLRDFAQWLPVDAKKAEPSHLWRFIVEHLEAQNLAFATEALDHCTRQNHIG